MLTLKYLKSILSYNPDTGKWCRLVTIHYNALIGSEAGCIGAHGYCIIKIAGKAYKSHRLAVFYMTGKWPRFVDHKDMDRSNDRWPNIRSCTRSQNHANTRARVDSASGIKGVFWHKRDRIWSSHIRVNGRLIYLGSFKSSDEAHQAYVNAANHHFGEFARAS